MVAGDTDGLAIKKPNESKFNQQECDEIINFINSRMDPLIRWEHDGVVKCQIVTAAKNYVLQDEKGKIKIKGSSLKATTKEKALQRFIKEVIDLLLAGRKDHIYSIYFDYAKKIMNVTDINDWCMKKTVTKSVLEPSRKQEQNVLDALKGTEFNEGDKVYLFNRTETELCLRDRFDGVYCKETLLGKLYDTLSIFDTVIDIEMIPNLTLKRNAKLIQKY